MSKRAPAEHPIHDLIAERWSPVVFSDASLAPKEIRTLFEAARWAPSAFNEQPWRYIVGVKGDDGTWLRLLDCLAEANQTWAQHAPVLTLGVAATHFAHNEKENRHAFYDLGQASANLSLQATAMGLYLHQMAGFSGERARELFALPAGHEPVVCMAVGRLGDPAAADATLARRDLAPRARNGIDEFVCGSTWAAFPDALRD